MKVGQQLGKSGTLIDRWGSTWKWAERVRAYDNHLIELENTAQRNEVRKRAINKGILHEKAYRAKVKYISYLAAKDPDELSRAEVAILMKAESDLYRDHRDMFALTAHEQAQADIQNARIDVELLRLEAAQAVPSDGQGGSNFIAALEKAASYAWCGDGQMQLGDFSEECEDSE